MALRTTRALPPVMPCMFIYFLQEFAIFVPTHFAVMCVGLSDELHGWCVVWSGTTGIVPVE